MSTLSIVSLVLIGIAALAVNIKKMGKFTDFLNLVLFCTLILGLGSLEGEVFNGEGKVLGYVLIIHTVLQFLIGRIKLLRKPFLRVMVPILGMIVFFLMDGEMSLNDAGFKFSLSDKLVLVGAILAVLAYEIGTLKAKVLGSLFGLESEKVAHAVVLVIVGIVVFMELFAGAGMGLLIASAGYLWSTFYRDANEKQVNYTFWALVAAAPILRLSDVVEVQFLLGKVLEGVFLGAAAVLIVNVFSSATRRIVASNIVGNILGILLLFVLLWLGTIYTGIGGMDAFLGGFIGFAVANALIGKETESATFFAWLLAGGLLIPGLLVNEELKEFEKTLETITDESSEEKGPTVLPLDEITGNYEVVKETSLVSFQLGPKGAVTKGAVRNFDGKISIAEDLMKSSFDIEMPVVNLTTFISMRDKEVWGKNYLNSDAFPKMRFKSNELVALENEANTYQANGTFEMLGVKKDLSLTVKRIEEDGKKVLTGQGEIDRRQFGMKADDKEGNIVEFTFKVELK